MAQMHRRFYSGLLLERGFHIQHDTSLQKYPRLTQIKTPIKVPFCIATPVG